MRIIHTGDLHLDAVSEPSLSPNDSFQTISSPQRWRTFQRLINYANDRTADLLLISGDLFNRQPTEAQLREVDGLFSALTCTQVVLIAGNHDFLSAASPMTGYQWAGPVTLLPSVPDSCAFFAGLNTIVHGFSYSSCRMQDKLYHHISAPKDKYTHILMIHGGDADHLPLHFSSLEQSGYDYIALGHIHKPHIFPSRQMAYCGSLEPLDQTETGNHGFIQIDINRHNVRTSFIPFSHTRFIPLSFQVTPEDTLFSLRRALVQRIDRGSPGDFYSVTFSGQRDPELVLSTESFSDLKQLYELSDSTSPWYDFHSLLRQHGTDLVGQYICAFLPGDKSIENLDELQRQALYFGLKALLDSSK